MQCIHSPHRDLITFQRNNIPKTERKNPCGHSLQRSLCKMSVVPSAIHHKSESLSKKWMPSFPPLLNWTSPAQHNSNTINALEVINFFARTFNSDKPCVCLFVYWLKNFRIADLSSNFISIPTCWAGTWRLSRKWHFDGENLIKDHQFYPGETLGGTTWGLLHGFSVTLIMMII